MASEAATSETSVSSLLDELPPRRAERPSDRQASVSSWATAQAAAACASETCDSPSESDASEGLQHGPAVLQPRLQVAGGQLVRPPPLPPAAHLLYCLPSC